MNQPLDYAHSDMLMPGLGQQMLMPPPMMNTMGGMGLGGIPPMGMGSVTPGNNMMASMGGPMNSMSTGFNPMNSMNGFNFKQ
jgi:hypothetical protein